ncbi:MAG: GTP-binding protein [Spirochaetaceae bacterium]|jgi:bifunctional enzyme CysN/CysC/sulfate adenylyltransferase subunit 1|nr:GTP-binding protein [Spirochaetaceae bacterium]
MDETGNHAVQHSGQRMNIVITGHVDHGKSTLIGRLLADTGSLPEGKLQSVEDSCRKNGSVFEYAFLLDALADEQSQGITIDSARIFFRSKVREYIIIDAPGHIEFLRNMLSGASRAEAAILVIDAVEGVAENSKRHGLLLSLLGVTQALVAVNKMDIAGYDKAVFERVKTEYTRYLGALRVNPVAFVPVSAREGKNITTIAPEMPWYTGKTVLEILDSFEPLISNEDSFFAMPVQDIYRFSGGNDERRIYAGTVVSGEISAGDEVSFLPSGKTARIKSIEVWNAPPKFRTFPGEAAGFTLDEEIYVKRGEVMVKKSEQGFYESGGFVSSGDRMRANIIWLGSRPFGVNKNCLLKLGCEKVEVRLERIECFLGGEQENTGGGQNPARQHLERYECGSVILSLARPIAFSSFYDNADLGRFVIVDGFDAAGGGIALENLSAQKAWESLAGFEGLGIDGFEDELFALLKKHFPHRFA